MRRRLVSVIASVKVTGVTLYQPGVEPGRAERARQHMLWSLTFVLLQRGVSDLVLEARERQLNRRDQTTLAAISRTPAASGLRYTFARPLDEPLLWLPDYLVAMHGTARFDGKSTWLGRLPPDLREVIEVSSRRP